MRKYRSRNHELNALWKDGGLQDLTSDRRALVFAAVQQQLDHDNKRPWSLSQKLNDAPYRYTRDTLWAALNSISVVLAAGNPAIDFGVEDKFRHPTIARFSDFVNARLTKSVSSLINGILDASRWA